MTSTLSEIWKNNDVCAEQYICVSALYLMSVLSQSHSIIVDRGISPPGHDKYVVDGIRVIANHHMYQLMSNVKLPGSTTFGSQILMHSCTPKNDVSLAK